MNCASNLNLSIALPGHALNPFSDGGSGSGCNNRNARELGIHLDLNHSHNGGEEELQQGGSVEVQEGEERGSARDKSSKHTRLSREHYKQLDEFYRLDPNIGSKQKKELADRLNLRTTQVDAWFRNRRARAKRQSTETECANLKEENHKLKEENHRLEVHIWELREMLLQLQPTFTAPSGQQADSAASATMVTYF